MRYIIVLIAYTFAAFLLALAFLFPNRPADLAGLFLLMLALVPILAVFDLIGQTIIDSQKISQMGAAARPLLGSAAFVAFLGLVYLAVNFMAPATIPW